MNDSELISMFKDALNDVVPGRERDFDAITLETSIEDLSVDSVTFMELIGFIEDKTGKTFADDQLSRVGKFSDIADLIRG